MTNDLLVFRTLVFKNSYNFSQWKGAWKFINCKVTCLKCSLKKFNDWIKPNLIFSLMKSLSRITTPAPSVNQNRNSFWKSLYRKFTDYTWNVSLTLAILCVLIILFKKSDVFFYIFAKQQMSIRWKYLSIPQIWIVFALYSIYYSNQKHNCRSQLYMS